MIYPSIAILRSYAPYLCVGSSFIFSSMRRFSSSVTQNFTCMFRFRFAIKRLHFYKGLGYPNKHFSFSGKGPENTEKSQVGTHLLCLLSFLFSYLSNTNFGILATVFKRKCAFLSSCCVSLLTSNHSVTIIDAVTERSHLSRLPEQYARR